jgi:hypothetical protein
VDGPNNEEVESPTKLKLLNLALDPSQNKEAYSLGSSLDDAVMVNPIAKELRSRRISLLGEEIGS